MRDKGQKGINNSASKPRMIVKTLCVARHLACDVSRSNQQLRQHRSASALRHASQSSAETRVRHTGLPAQVGDGCCCWWTEPIEVKQLLTRHHLTLHTSRYSCAHTRIITVITICITTTTTCSHGQHHRHCVTRHNLLLRDGVAHGQVVQRACNSVTVLQHDSEKWFGIAPAAALDSMPSLLLIMLHIRLNAAGCTIALQKERKKREEREHSTCTSC